MAPSIQRGKDRLMNIQSKLNTFATTLITAFVCVTVGCDSPPPGQTEPGGVVTPPPGGIQLAVCTSTFTSNPGTVKTEPPNQTESYDCTTTIPPCPSPYTRTIGAYGSADDSFRYSCAVPVTCAQGYDLVAHQQSSTKFQYRCEVKGVIN